MSETVNVQETAKLMGAHPKTVLEKIASGELHAAKIGKGYVLMRSHVLEMIDREIAKQTAERIGVVHQPRRTSRRRPSLRLHTSK